MNEQYLILKKHEDLLTAQHQAQLEYERFFRQFYDNIASAHHTVLRELYADEGNVAYIIDIQFTEQTTPGEIARMQEWSHEYLSNDLPFSQRWQTSMLSLRHALEESAAKYA